MPDEKKEVIDCLRQTGFFKPKKIYDGVKVIIGIIILFAFLALPFFYNMAMGKAVKVPEPKIDTPAIQKLPEKERVCIEPKAYMRENHMKLLDDWRDQVVRDGNRDYKGYTKKYTISLQNTCLKCHSNYDNFCDECHKYMGIKPYCWTCHVDKPKEWATEKLEGEK